MKIQIIQIINQGLKVIIKNPIILAPILISAVLNCIFLYFFAYAPKPAVIEGIEMPFQGLPEHFVLSNILLSFISLFLSLIISKMVYDAVKNKVSISEAINLSVKKIIFVFIATMLAILIVLIGLIALIIPGIFLFIKFTFIGYFILFDNEKIINSFKKSWQIVTGNWWRVFGLFLIFLIPFAILSGTANAIAPDAVQVALALDFVSFLLLGWMMSAFTVAYIQLTNNIEREKKEIVK